MRCKGELTLSALFVLVMSGVPAAAQYPNKTITVIVPFAAGGPTDVVTLLLGDHMSRTLGQTIIVENVGGAGGTIGMTRAAQAEPDTPSRSAIPERSRQHRRSTRI